MLQEAMVGGSGDLEISIVSVSPLSVFAAFVSGTNARRAGFTLRAWMWVAP